MARNVKVSIPLEQGNVFRLREISNAKADINVSIPLEQGNVFRRYVRCSR